MVHLLLTHTHHTHTHTHTTHTQVMPISAQEWRVRTGINNAGKGAWLSSRKTNHTHLYPTSGHTGKEKLEEARNIHWVWLVAMVTLVIPLLYRVCTMMFMVLEVLLHVGLRGGGGSKLIVMNTYNNLHCDCTILAMARRV